MTGTMILRCRNCHQIFGELRDTTCIEGWEWCLTCVNREKRLKKTDKEKGSGDKNV